MTSERTPSGGRGSADAPFDFRDHLRRQRDTFLDGPATNTTIIDLRAWLERRRPEPTILDDLRDLWAEITASPTSHAVVGFGGVLVGLATIIVPALVWSLFL
jgi:hypothetical protein